MASLKELLKELDDSFKEKKFSESSNIFFKIEKIIFEQKLFLSFEENQFLAIVACELGFFRRSISFHRKSLLQTQSFAKLSFIHLQLCKIYRILIQMKSARYELQLAFQYAQVPFPHNNLPCLFLLLSNYFRRITLSESEKIQTVALYEEAGLSGYYFRHYLTMLQCSLGVRRIALSLGPSLQLLDWYGATACLLAFSGFKDKAESYLEVVDTLSKKNISSYKAQYWKGLCNDYLGKPFAAEECFIHCLKDSSITIFDRRLILMTYLLHQSLKGDAKSALKLFKEQQNLFPEDNFQLPIQEKNLIEFYSIGLLSLEGNFADSEVIIQKSRAIFAQSHQEKWLIAEFLGQLLMHYYFKKDYFNVEVFEAYQRFALLELSPRTTPIEATLFWVAKAYLQLKKFEASPCNENKKDFLMALNDLSQTPSHPAIKAHLLLLKSKFSKTSTEKTQEWAKKYENHWVLKELNV